MKASFRPVAAITPVLAFAIGVAQGGTLLPCTGATMLAQEEQSNCIVFNQGLLQAGGIGYVEEGGSVAPSYTLSFTNDPTFVNTPVSQTVTKYQTTLTAILNGGTTIIQEILDAPFSDPSVQSAILAAGGLLTSDGASFGSPFLTSTSTTLQSSVTSPTLDLPTLISCGIGPSVTGTCAGVTVTDNGSSSVIFGPATIMIGPDYSDEFTLVSDEENINVNEDFVYTVQNAVTTNTYLTTSSCEIDGVTNVSSASAVPEPGTWVMAVVGLGGIWLARRRRQVGNPLHRRAVAGFSGDFATPAESRRQPGLAAPRGHGNWRIGLLVAVAFAIGVAQGGPLPACAGTIVDLSSQGYDVYPTQPDCFVANPSSGAIVFTDSIMNDPTYMNTPVNQTVNQYQTTLTAILNGGTTIFSETLDAPFSDPSVQSAILAADGLLTSDRATFGSPLLDSTSTTLQSSVLSYVTTSTVLDLPTLIGCLVNATGTCSGVAVTVAGAYDTVYFGPATTMIGPDLSDEFDVLGGQEDINVYADFVYTVDQNAVTTNTYLTTSSYEIDGTTSVSSASAVPEPGTWATCAMSLGGLGGIWFVRRKRQVGNLVSGESPSM